MLKWQKQAEIPAKISDGNQDKHSSSVYSLPKHREIKSNSYTGRSNKTESLSFR